MPRLTPEERAELEARLAADTDDGDDEEIEIGKGDEYYRGSRRGARTWAAARGMKLEPDPEPEEDPKAKGQGGKVVQGRGFGKAPYGRRTG